MKRALVVVGAGLLAIVMAAPAGAQTGPGDTPSDEYVEEEPIGTVNPDGSVTVLGECVEAETVPWEVRRGASTRGPLVDEGTATTTEDEYQFTTDPLRNGRHTIAITCGQDVQVLGVSVTRGQAGTALPTLGGTGTAGRLPQTGDDSARPLTQLGVGLLAAGGVAAYAAKKRRQDRVTA
jgi:LPXTG-motif cell wall-anchored protein